MKLPNVQEKVKRFTRVQKILISIICIVILFGMITIFTGPNMISKLGYDTFSMLRYSLIDNPAKTIANWQQDFSNLRGVQEENDELKSVIASQKMYKAELDEKTRELKELESLVELESISIYEKEYANVVSRDISTWSNSITLNKGTSNGIKENMAVVSAKGLIGKVIHVNEYTCKVKLLSSPTDDINVSVKVELENATTEGILQEYDENKKRYKIQTFDASAKIEKGMRVITSGNGGVFPAGILVGKVESVSDLYNAKGKIVNVKPSVNFNDFDYVAILKVGS